MKRFVIAGMFGLGIAGTLLAGPVARYAPEGLKADKAGVVLEWKDAQGGNPAVPVSGTEVHLKAVEFPAGAFPVAEFGMSGAGLKINGSKAFEGRDRSWIVLFKPDNPKPERQQLLVSAAYRTGPSRSNYAWGAFLNENGVNGFARNQGGVMRNAKAEYGEAEWMIAVVSVQYNNNIRIRVIPLQDSDFDPEDQQSLHYAASGKVDAIPQGCEHVAVGCTSSRFSHFFQGQMAEIRFYNVNLNQNDAWASEVKSIQQKFNGK